MECKSLVHVQENIREKTKRIWELLKKLSNPHQTNPNILNKKQQTHLKFQNPPLWSRTQKRISNYENDPKWSCLFSEYLENIPRKLRARCSMIEFEKRKPSNREKKWWETKNNSEWKDGNDETKGWLSIDINRGKCWFKYAIFGLEK